MRYRGVIAGLSFDKGAVLRTVREHAEDGVGLGEGALTHPDVIPVTGKFPFFGVGYMSCGHRVEVNVASEMEKVSIVVHKNRLKGP